MVPMPDTVIGCPECGTELDVTIHDVEMTNLDMEYPCPVCEESLFSKLARTAKGRFGIGNFHAEVSRLD